MSKLNTFIIPIIHSANIAKCLETLDKYTEDNYNIIVIDQTTTNEAYLNNHFKTNLWIRSYRNLGFSKAMNTGIRLTDTPYITLLNDDTEFIHKNWWQGILDTFATDKRILAVNPMSPKEGSFGYGYQEQNKDTWLPPEQYVCASDKTFVYPKQPDGKGLFYKETFTDEDWEFLTKHHPRYPEGTVVDGLCMWATVFSKDGIEKLGLLDERFFPGSGEDYDMNARAYSRDFRMVSTSRSWIWHHWSSSKNAKDGIMVPQREQWNRLDVLWPFGFDLWGKRNNKDGTRTPYPRTPDIFIDEL